MYFNSSGELSEIAPSESSVLSYNSESAESVSFTHTFSETTRLVGLPKAVVYMSCPDHDDMDIYIQLEKLSKSGEPMVNLNIPCKHPSSTYLIDNILIPEFRGGASHQVIFRVHTKGSNRSSTIPWP